MTILSQPSKIFISYSHVDAEYLRRLLIHLSPYERRGLINVWADTKLSAGRDWFRDVVQAISEADVAILLISADFLASKFIADNELPPLLHRAEADGTRIIPVILKPCAYDDIPELSRFQTVNDARTPLLAMTEVEIENVWVQVARTVKQSISNSSDRQVLKIQVPSEPQSLETFEDFLEPLSSGEDEYDYIDSFLAHEIRNPRSIHKYFVYEYQHLDELEFIKDAHRYTQHIPNRDEILKEVSHLFEHSGWEGDGDLGLIWFPPFVDAGIEDTWGFVVWHVKQSNNGTSWLASPYELPFKRLQYQNN
jgi:hypothetical protein